MRPSLRGNQHAYGMNRIIWNEEEFHLNKQYYDDSPVGAIDVIVAVRVLDLMIKDDNIVPLLEVGLSVEPLGETGKPESWSVSYVHFPDCILDGFEEFQKKYCPAPDQVLETFRSFKYRSS